VQTALLLMVLTALVQTELLLMARTVLVQIA